MLVTLVTASVTPCQAESLLELSKYFGSEFKTLLRFLVRVSKQEKLAHVWLATSSWGLTGLLEKGELEHTSRWGCRW
jgi:hypothetical protein